MDSFTYGTKTSTGIFARKEPRLAGASNSHGRGEQSVSPSCNLAGPVYGRARCSPMLVTLKFLLEKITLYTTIILPLLRIEQEAGGRARLAH